MNIRLCWLVWISAPSVLFAQSTFVVMENNIPQTVWSVQNGKPQIGTGGKIHSGSGRNTSLIKASAYGEAFITFGKFEVGVSHTQDVSTGATVGSELNITGRIKSDTALTHCFMVVELFGTGTTRTVFTGLPDLAAGEDQDLDVSFPATAGVDSGRFTVHVFANGVELLHSLMHAEYLAVQQQKVQTARLLASQPDSDPAPVHQVEPVYPEELKSANLAGNAKIRCHISAEGEVVDAQVAETSNPFFGAAAVEAVKQWKFLPAVKNHQYAEATVAIPFDFAAPTIAPTPAAETAPAATTDSYPPPVTPAPETAAPAAEAATTTPPAEDAGPLAGHPDSPPIPVNQPAAIYPDELRNENIAGSAKVRCTIDTKGEVSNSQIVESSRSAFGIAAFSASLQWTFQPAVKNHQYVESTVVIPFNFSPPGVTLITDSPPPAPPAPVVEAPPAATPPPAPVAVAPVAEATAQSSDDAEGQQKKAEVLLYLHDHPDSDATPLNPITPSYPAQLKPNGGSGSARISCRINVNGDVTGAKIVDASNPLFGSAALTAIRMSRFLPAIKTHQFAASTVVLAFDFTASSPVASSGNPSLSPDDVADQQRLAEVLLYLRDQPDSDALPVNPIAPGYPAQLRPDGGAGSARISCRVTASGDATGVKIVEASNPLFGSAALTAVRMSRFLPAIKDHQFVDSTVVIPVSFAAPGH